jgi:hypothetical protein
MRVVVHSAAIQDRDGAGLVLDKIRRRFPRLELFWADGGYNAWQVEAAVAKVPLGGRAHLLLVRTKPASCQGLREPCRNPGQLRYPRLDPAGRQAACQGVGCNGAMMEVRKGDTERARHRRGDTGAHAAVGRLQHHHHPGKCQRGTGERIGADAPEKESVERDDAGPADTTGSSVRRRRGRSRRSLASATVGCWRKQPTTPGGSARLSNAVAESLVAISRMVTAIFATRPAQSSS